MQETQLACTPFLIRRDLYLHQDSAQHRKPLHIHKRSAAISRYSIKLIRCSKSGNKQKSISIDHKLYSKTANRNDHVLKQDRRAESK